MLAEHAKSKRVKRAAATTLCALMLIWFVPCSAHAETPRIQAGGYVLIEAGSRTVLAGENAHAKLPMASTTKIMTALLAIERCAPDELVETPPEAYGTEGSSMYLDRGEKLSVIDLLYGLMLVSGNDAAVTLAVHIAGSVEDFAKLMNARARELGCQNTNFVTPNGLPDDDHYTSAYDLALICAKAMEYDLFKTIAGSEYYRTETGKVVRTLKNKNKLLWQYDGGCGIKTGYTKSAGKCLAFAAERDNMMLIGVLLKCPDMFNCAMALLDHGFGNYELVSAIAKGQTIARIEVVNGEKNALALVAKEDIIIPVRKGETLELKTRLELPDGVIAPIDAGDVLGSVSVIQGTASFGATSELVAAETIGSRRYSDWLTMLIKRWSA